MVPGRLLLCFNIFFSLVYKSISICDKTPEGVVKPNDRDVGGKYFLEISGNPNGYKPQQRYNISLKSGYRQSFTSFRIILEPDNIENEDHNLGRLGYENGTEMLARIDHVCPNTIIQSSVVHKREIHVYWISPPSGSGCVNIKATVVKSKEKWFSEDGSLTKRLCEDTSEDENVQPKTLEKCCACDEAKYELVFEGKWIRNTHPKYFPINVWNTKFSDVIGASHQSNHSFWAYGSVATQGLKELAESGDTRTLESELTNDSKHTRTIIKARGPQYPSITKPASTIFRVDKKNHLVSLVTKIMPSPDWIVGVADLELCTEECTWKEKVTLNLHPWDAGIDNGLKYESSEPIEDWQPIQQITSNNPNNSESPFYSEKDEQIKPIAKLRVTRLRLYPKACEIGTEEEIDCSRSDWLNWAPCSASCGTGTRIRQRAYMDEKQATECGLNFEDREICFEHCTTENNSTDNVRICSDEDENCKEDPNCPDTEWGEWSDCSVTCGNGTKRRMKISMHEIQSEDSKCLAWESAPCSVSDQCNDEIEPTSIAESSEQMYSRLGSRSSILFKGAVGEVINCKVSGWSAWSKCKARQGTCGNGYKYKSREIKIHPANGGKECPKKLSKFKRCVVNCTSDSNLQGCEMGPWTSWTPCSSNCGATAVQIQTRQIISQPPGVKCPTRRRSRQCKLALACTEDGQPIFTG